MALEGNHSEHDKDFIIRQANSLDDLQWVLKLATEEGWAPREKEAEYYFLADLTTGFYIGELNGKRIGCFGLIIHEPTVASAGFHIVAEPYRGQGYGKKLLEYALTVTDGWQISQFTPEFTKEMYQGMGYKVGWNVRQYHFTVSSAIEGLASSKVPPSVEILPASQGDFEKMFAYSADMLGTSRTCRSSLAAWLCYLQESSWVAVANKREVVGLLMMSRTSRFPEEGYHIGPFYADSAPIARSLLKVAVDFARASNPGHIYLRLPADRNPEGVKILENEIGAECVIELVFMTNGEIPKKCLSKVYSGSG